MLKSITHSIPLYWEKITNEANTWMGRSVQVITNSVSSASAAIRNHSFVPDLSKNMGWNIPGKKIVFCADGTWQTPENNTNVYKIFKAILAAPDQIAFYDDGVGSDGIAIEKLAGGAMGIGLFEKIKTGYSTIAKNYKPGDDIFIFGFSRGAYTAQSLAGMISLCGLPTAPFDEKFIDKIFEAYRRPEERQSILKELSSYKLSNTPIKMVGVWDTVGSLGIPSVLGQIGPLYSSLDTSLHPNIKNAYHAVAIDESRPQFPPTLWSTKEVVPGQTLEQVWFPGAHGNVGGGSSKTGLSDICLSWMMKKAENLGLRIDPNIAQHPIGMTQVLEKFQEPWYPFWPSLREVPIDASLSNTVAIRCENDKSYRPKNLKFEKGKLAQSYSIQETVNLEKATV